MVEQRWDSEEEHLGPTWRRPCSTWELLVSDERKPTGWLDQKGGLGESHENLVQDV